jgi:hypothetical protein
MSADHLYPLGDHTGAETSIPQHLLVSVSHDPAIFRPGYSLRKAKALRKLARRASHLDLDIDFLEGGTGSILDEMLPDDLLQASSSEHNSDGDVVLGRLTERRFPSEVVLVRSPEGQVRVRKTFCAGFASNFQRELQARSLLDDRRLSPILATSGMSLYLPWYRDYRSFPGGLFRFYPIKAARNVIDFLEMLSGKGLAMLDINPNSFLYDSDGNLKVVDCEYLTATGVEHEFSCSLDYRGKSPESSLDGPRATGWNHFWRDAVGAPYTVVRSGSPLALAGWRAAQIVVRLLKLPVALLDQGRKAVLSTLYYWRRRYPWGIRIHGRYSRAESLSSQTPMTLQPLPGSRKPSHAKY